MSYTSWNAIVESPAAFDADYVRRTENVPKVLGNVPKALGNVPKAVGDDATVGMSGVGCDLNAPRED